MAIERKNFRRFTFTEYIDYLRPFVSQVKFSQVHVHGTWKPTIADYRKAKDKMKIIQGMWRFHTVTNKWGDIAQHATIDPDGYIWEGRSLLEAPASSVGFNDPDHDRIHPFMFEMIGNFDIGAEKLEGSQLAAAVKLTNAILTMWKLPHEQIKFHREMNPGKTCPGSGINKSAFVQLVRDLPSMELSVDDANKVIENWLSPAWFAASTKAEKDEIHRLANELRKASGQL
ncbi:peptidoglycan recognition protein family protein [Paenibacillus alkaliterrae]|uniref:peptidoglycan recognition protein family protein n=1 Tax=Paenibacillus alkaliterrae TaxID=320909 RepID=UPI001F277097|nr:peptidoglycan recognition family protein [Paenibacillus alkaliterrae]MCF2937848.1 peptidoglycan recognition protein family protein [Paenibacillus alkaliterrae]